MSDQRELSPEEATIAALLRQLTSEDAERVEPPEDLWDLIATEALDSEPIESTRTAAGPGLVISLDARRRLRSATTSILGVAAGLVLLAGIAAVVLRDSNDLTVVARAALSYDEANFDVLGADAVAEVALVDDDGRLRIDIEQSDLPAPDGEDADLEIWLIEPDADGNVAGIVSLGLVDPDDRASFDIPASYDPDRFFIVDISVEPHDGDAAHSGRSILRGPLAKV